VIFNFVSFLQREHLKVAQQFFQLVGGSASECDTIPGRQCMSMCFFLLKQFDDVLLYLSSIKSYYYNDDNFNFNYAQVRKLILFCIYCKILLNIFQAKAAVGSFKEAEETFLIVQSEKIRQDPVFILMLCRCCT
jgi:intraflagellar transport protein 56